jgi:hypothetical protein
MLPTIVVTPSGAAPLLLSFGRAVSSRTPCRVLPHPLAGSLASSPTDDQHVFCAGASRARAAARLNQARLRRLKHTIKG